MTHLGDCTGCTDAHGEGGGATHQLGTNQHPERPARHEPVMEARGSEDSADGAQPWRALPEWGVVLREAWELVARARIDHGNLDGKYPVPDAAKIIPALDALCATAWNEARAEGIAEGAHHWEISAAAKAGRVHAARLLDALRHAELHPRGQRAGGCDGCEDVRMLLGAEE